MIGKTLLAASAVALMSTPAWALPNQAPSNQGTGHAPSTTPVGPPSTTPAGPPTTTPRPPSTTPVGPPATTPVGPPSTTHNDNPGGVRRHPGDDGGDRSTRRGAGPANPANHPAKPGHPGHPAHPTHPTHPTHPAHPGNPGHPSTSHACTPHKVAYVASGTLVSQTLSENADGTYSGEVAVGVTHTNHHAAGDKGTTKTYTVTGARVTFRLSDTNHDGSVGLDDLQAGDRVKIIGGITALAKKCDQSSFTARTTIRRIIFHPPAS